MPQGDTLSFSGKYFVDGNMQGSNNPISFSNSAYAGSMDFDNDVVLLGKAILSSGVSFNDSISVC